MDIIWSKVKTKSKDWGSFCIKPVLNKHLFQQTLDTDQIVFVHCLANVTDHQPMLNQHNNMTYFSQWPIYMIYTEVTLAL